VKSFEIPRVLHCLVRLAMPPQSPMNFVSFFLLPVSEVLEDTGKKGVTTKKISQKKTAQEILRSSLPASEGGKIAGNFYSFALFFFAIVSVRTMTRMPAMINPVATSTSEEMPDGNNHWYFSTILSPLLLRTYSPI